MKITLQVASVLNTGGAQNNGKPTQTVRLAAATQPDGSGIKVPSGTTMSIIIEDAAQMNQFQVDQLVAVEIKPAPVTPSTGV